MSNQNANLQSPIVVQLSMSDDQVLLLTEAIAETLSTNFNNQQVSKDDNQDIVINEDGWKFRKYSRYSKLPETINYAQHLRDLGFPEKLTPAQAAKILHIQVGTLRTYSSSGGISQHVIPATPETSAHLYFKLEEVAAYALRNKQRATNYWLLESK